MRWHLISALIAILLGYGLTLVFYMAGEPFVKPALLLARLFATDSGGDSLLPAFLVISTILCSIPAYLVLYLAFKRMR